MALLTRIVLLFPFQIYSSRELEESMNKIREVLSDEKQDWEHRVVAVSDFLPFPALVDKIQVILRIMEYVLD